LTRAAASKLNKWFRYTVLGEHRDETVDPKPLKYVPAPGSLAQMRDRALKALLILAIVAYVIYLAVAMIILFAQQVDDPPLKTRIYAPKLGSGEPNFPRCAAVLHRKPHTRLNRPRRAHVALRRAAPCSTRTSTSRK